MHPFRAAVEAHDMDAAVALLSSDVVFRSPVVFRPYEGRDAVAPLLHAVAQVFEDFEYVREIGDGADHALMFRAHVGDMQVEGVDLIRENEAGEISEFVVMLRPLKGVLAVAEAMRARLTAGA